MDTIGAGDNFASGFIAALLEGKNLGNAHALPMQRWLIGSKRRNHHRRKKHKAGRAMAGEDQG
ncbi:PfkB family carbohydrate kinase [Escherichia coli]